MRVSSMARPGAGCGCGCDRATIRWAVVRVGGGWVGEWCWPLPPKHTVQQRQHCRHQLHCLPLAASCHILPPVQYSSQCSQSYSYLLPCLCSWSVKIVHSIFHFSLISVSPEQLTRGEILFCHPQNIIKEKDVNLQAQESSAAGSRWHPRGHPRVTPRRTRGGGTRSATSILLTLFIVAKSIFYKILRIANYILALLLLKTINVDLKPTLISSINPIRICMQIANPLRLHCTFTFPIVTWIFCRQFARSQVTRRKISMLIFVPL